jgi:hypothetical protein
MIFFCSITYVLFFRNGYGDETFQEEVTHAASWSIYYECLYSVLVYLRYIFLSPNFKESVII